MTSIKNNNKTLEKNKLRTVPLALMETNLPDLSQAKGNKEASVFNWFKLWIQESLKTNIIKAGDLLPSKKSIAYLLGVSTGTIQNVYRNLEDMGLIESKQCIGTMIKNSNSNSNLRKLTSKREVVVGAVKKYIKDHMYKLNEELPATRKLAQEIGSSPNTIRLALEFLTSQGILKRTEGWSINSLDFDLETNENYETLVNKIVNELKNYIKENLKIGDKIPSHGKLAGLMNVSLKTVHDALQVLIEEGILLARRGRYGTSVLRIPQDNMLFSPTPETSIFATAQETAFYYYEKTQNKIKEMIASHYQIGEKLPSIMQLSQMMDLSPNTIRKAFKNLAKDGYITFTRGRYGGTFVIDIPELENEQAFKWLAVSKDYVSEKV